MANNGTIDSTASAGPKGPATEAKAPVGGILGSLLGALLFFINPFLGLAGAVGGWFGGKAIQDNTKSPATSADAAGAALSNAGATASGVAQNVTKSLSGDPIKPADNNKDVADATPMGDSTKGTAAVAGTGWAAAEVGGHFAGKAVNAIGATLKKADIPVVKIKDGITEVTSRRATLLENFKKADGWSPTRGVVNGGKAGLRFVSGGRLFPNPSVPSVANPPANEVGFFGKIGNWFKNIFSRGGTTAASGATNTVSEVAENAKFVGKRAPIVAGVIGAGETVIDAAHGRYKDAAGDAVGTAGGVAGAAAAGAAIGAVAGLGVFDEITVPVGGLIGLIGGVLGFWGGSAAGKAVTKRVIGSDDDKAQNASQAEYGNLTPTPGLPTKPLQPGQTH